jgi:hypothetical protein
MKLSPSATNALRKIEAFKKYPTPQSQQAINKVLQTLSVPDFMAVVQILEDVTPAPTVAPLDRAVTNV